MDPPGLLVLYVSIALLCAIEPRPAMPYLTDAPVSSAGGDGGTGHPHRLLLPVPGGEGV